MTTPLLCTFAIHIYGGASDAVAVRGDAGSGLATAGTGGIEKMVGPVSSGIQSPDRLGRARCCKSGGIAGNFGGDRRPLSAVRMKICFAMSRASEMKGFRRNAHRPRDLAAAHTAACGQYLYVDGRLV